MSTIIWLPPNPTKEHIEKARKKLRRYKQSIGWTKQDDITGMKLSEEKNGP